MRMWKPSAPVVSIVHRRDKLEIVARRRRLWYEVRTKTGKEEVGA